MRAAMQRALVHPHRCSSTGPRGRSARRTAPPTSSIPFHPLRGASWPADCLLLETICLIPPTPPPHPRAAALRACAVAGVRGCALLTGHATHPRPLQLRKLRTTAVKVVTERALEQRERERERERAEAAAAAAAAVRRVCAWKARSASCLNCPIVTRAPPHGRGCPRRCRRGSRRWRRPRRAPAPTSPS
jgi:hypothetical protein